MGKCNVVHDGEGSSNEVPVSLPNNHGGKNDLYNERWHACAGPLVNVPRAGQTVVYFPQGHVEQVEAYMNQDGQMEMPIYNLPSNILCKVVCVQLKVEAGTDEVYAQIILIPVAKQDGLSSNEDECSLPSPRRTNTRSFSKKLTSSDTNTHGGFSVLKRHAEECLPPMDMSRDPPEQKLTAKDLHGSEWSFRHVYRGNPKRHLLTTGWSSFVTSKKLLPKDTLIFIRGEKGEIYIGVRRARPLNNASTTVISASSMQHGIFAMAFHAINTGTPFTVYYRPWTTPTEFIIPFDKYMSSVELDYPVGTRFRMLFEAEECPEQRVERFEGTIVANEDVDPTRWTNSEWRSLKVKWDATSDGFVRPERVSPWDIEIIEPTKRKHTSVLPPVKRACVQDASVPGFPSMFKDGLLHGLVEYAKQNHLEVFQGQENQATGLNKLGALESPLLPHAVPLNPDLNNKPLGLGDQPCFPAHGPSYPGPIGTVLFSGGNIAMLGLPKSCSPPLSSYGIPEKATKSRNLLVMNSNSYSSGSEDQRTLGRKDVNEVPHAPPKGGGRYMLFGVNLVKNPPELPSPQDATNSDHGNPYSVSSMSQSSVSKPSKSTSATNSGSQRKNCASSTNSHCIKVLKYGSAGRSVDLTRFDGYAELIRELDQMFDFKGSLIYGNSGWQGFSAQGQKDFNLLERRYWLAESNLTDSSGRGITLA